MGLALCKLNCSACALSVVQQMLNHPEQIDCPERSIIFPAVILHNGIPGFQRLPGLSIEASTKALISFTTAAKTGWNLTFGLLQELLRPRSGCISTAQGGLNETRRTIWMSSRRMGV